MQRTFVRLHSFNIERPIGGTGPLYYPNMIIIPDNHISVILTYPLSSSVKVNIRSLYQMDLL